MSSAVAEQRNDLCDAFAAQFSELRDAVAALDAYCGYPR